MSSFLVRNAKPGDVAEVTRLVGAVDEAFIGRNETSLADIEDEWRRLDLARDALVVEEAGRMVGYGTVEERPGLGRADGYVDPAQTGRGVGALLVSQLEAELVARGATCIQNATLLADTRAHDLLRSHGYEEVRRFRQMRIALEREPTAPVWPDGVEVTSFDPADAEAFHEAYESAFADHWQHHRRTFEEWRREQLDREGFSPDLWTVVRANGEIVAGTICLPERGGVAWVSRLFTRADWRRRGIGEALLHDAFAKFRRLGKREAGLGVDATSTTGADRLYERVGMHVHWAAVVFEKRIDA